MEPILFVLGGLVLAWTQEVLFPKPKPPEPPKTPEQQLGEAIGKYLAKGVRVDEIKIKMDD
ncbi:hypothetical protein [Leptolyngbya ohadii]|uniref:hypothetical protein n=1 Tax=Leptolyngbya ohadii TaxID=1962290 RepID=UPI000B5989FA|nr:hypothetical protein [Leptolyngbya ohadii]